MNIQQMQMTVDQIFSRLGTKTTLVLVKNTNNTIAGAIGLKIIKPLLGFEPPSVGGIVLINEKSLKGFTDQEIQFILAHECSHIFNNHIVSKLFWNLLEKILKGEQNENYQLIEILKAFLALVSPSHLPPNAENLRNQEYEADHLAVSITGDLSSAISCLSKLVGNDMNAPSHTWELFGSVVPAMTMGQRLDALRGTFERI